MRATAYLIAMTSLLSVLIVFATVPAIAAEPEGGGSSMGTPPPMNGSGQMMSSSQNPMMGQQKAPMAGGAATQEKSGGTQPMSGSPQAAAPPTGAGSAQKGGEGFVVSVDQPENCLRIRAGPGSNFPMMGCAPRGQKLHLTGVFSSDGRWGQLKDNGWVFLSQIQTDLQIPRSMVSRPPSGYSNQGPWRGPAGSSYFYELEPEPFYEEIVPYGGFYYGSPWRRHKHGFWKGHRGGKHGGKKPH